MELCESCCIVNHIFLKLHESWTDKERLEFRGTSQTKLEERKITGPTLEQSTLSNSEQSGGSIVHYEVSMSTQSHV